MSIIVDIQDGRFDTCQLYCFGGLNSKLSLPVSLSLYQIVPPTLQTTIISYVYSFKMQRSLVQWNNNYIL